MTNFEAAEKAVRDILAERFRQDSKWGVQNHDPLKWMAILGEEYGEACAALLENREVEPRRYRDELIHVAAVAMAAVECFERRYPEQIQKAENDPERK